MELDPKKRLIPESHLRQLAADILVCLDAVPIAEVQVRISHLAEHLAGTLDAHCVLLQRALCVHCGNDVPLIYVEKWGEHLHNGELTCIASTSRAIMGIEPETQHLTKETGRGSPFL